MPSGSEMSKDNKGQLIRNDHWPPPNFRNIVNIETHIDDVGVFLSIPPRVFTVQDIRLCHRCKIGEIKDFEIKINYESYV